MKETPLANALAVITAGFYLICAFLALTTPQFLLAVFQSWFHGIDITTLATTQRNFGGFLLGLISLTVVAWISGYAFAWTYNQFSQKK